MLLYLELISHIGNYLYLKRTLQERSIKGETPSYIKLGLCRNRTHPSPEVSPEKLPFILTRWEPYECVACFKKVAQDLTTRASLVDRDTVWNHLNLSLLSLSLLYQP